MIELIKTLNQTSGIRILIYFGSAVLISVIIFDTIDNIVTKYFKSIKDKRKNENISKPLKEGKVKSNVKSTNMPGHRNAPPPPPIKQ